MKILLVSQYIRKLAGGAEKSTIELLKTWLAEGHEVTILTADGDGFANNSLYEDDIKEHVNEIVVPVKTLNIAPFIRYFLYRINSHKELSLCIDEFDEIVVFDFWGKAFAANNLSKISPKRLSIYVRSETDYLTYRNYQTGIRAAFWYCWFFIQFPFFKLFCADTLRMVRQAKITSNSQFVASKVREVFGLDSDVVYPFVDVTRLRQGFQHKPKFVTFIGDGKSKGIDIFLYLVEKNPQIAFKCVSRSHIGNLKTFPNLTHQDWTSDIKTLFEECRLLLVPSQWEEAYGRVAREAYLMNLPVLCSKIGGLPEAVDEVEHCLVSSYGDFNEWNVRLQKTLSLD